jgi:lipopolysaccharide biosynthesis protein
MDMGENKTFFDELCQKMEIEKVEETPLFPLGNMFWARVEAVRQLFYLNRDELLQQEPLPYDGSFIHAIERITPNLVENNNFKFVTVYKKDLKW